MASGTSKTFKHKSFKRSYREDYVRELEVPGMGQHIFYSFKLIFENYKIFLPLLFIMAIVAICLTGLSSEFLNGQTVIFGGLVFLIIWLVSIFIIRHKLAGNKVGIRDALYNAMTPFLSSFVVLTVAAVQCIPIMILVVAYSSAIETHFLDTPFYAFLFLAFAVLMILLSGYLLSSSIMALVAVSAPGLYPLDALKTASELMAGRRIRFILRMVALIITLVVMWVLIMMPLIMFDLFMKQFEWTRFIPFIPICLVMMTCFTAIYVSTYFYTYYRWILKFDTKEENGKKRRRKKNS